MDIRKVILGGLVASAVAVPATAASASATPLQTLTLPVDATTVLNNLPDGGGHHGYLKWATDDINRTIKITEVSQASGVYTYHASITDTGSFTAHSGALTPNQGFPNIGLIIKSDVTGHLTGTASYTFTANSLPTVTIPVSEPVALGATAENAVLGWYKQAFPGTTTFGPVANYIWSRTYSAQVAKGGYKPGGHYPGPGCIPGYDRHGKGDGKGGSGWNNDKKRGRGDCDPGRGHKPGHGSVPVYSYFQPKYVPTAFTNQAWVDSSSNNEGQLPADGNITGV